MADLATESRLPAVKYLPMLVLSKNASLNKLILVSRLLNIKARGSEYLHEQEPQDRHDMQVNLAQ